MKTVIFATWLLLLSCSALVLGWYWGLNPYFHWNDVTSGLGVADPTDDHATAERIRERYLVRFVSPGWVHPDKISYPLTSINNIYKSDLAAMWGLYETRSRIGFLFCTWFASIMLTFTLVTKQQSGVISRRKRLLYICGVVLLLREGIFWFLIYREWSGTASLEFLPLIVFLLPEMLIKAGDIFTAFSAMTMSVLLAIGSIAWVLGINVLFRFFKNIAN